MNLDLKDVGVKLVTLARQLGRYRTLFFIIFFACLYGFLVQRIDSLTRQEPDETEVLEELQTVKSPRIDEEAVKKIEQLEAQNIQVQTLFEEARRNPFAE